jgi:LPXTG-motif cell wall-anchored protein
MRKSVWTAMLILAQAVMSAQAPASERQTTAAPAWSPSRESVVTQEAKRTATGPPQLRLDSSAPIPIAVVRPAPQPAQAPAEAPAKLPKTGSSVPPIGLLGGLLCAVALLSLAGAERSQ